MPSLPAGYEVTDDIDYAGHDKIKWSGRLPVPAIGARVQVSHIPKNTPWAPPPDGIVDAYYIEYGWLGLQVHIDPKNRPTYHKNNWPNDDHYYPVGCDLIYPDDPPAAPPIA